MDNACWSDSCVYAIYSHTCARNALGLIRVYFVLVQLCALYKHSPCRLCVVDGMQMMSMYNPWPLERPHRVMPRHGARGLTPRRVGSPT